MNIKNKSHRVVVTGLGVVSSIGIGRENFWENLIQGKSGISEITSFDTSSYDRHVGGEVKGFNFKSYFNSNKRLVNIGRASQMAIVASKLALEDALFYSDSNTSKSFIVSIGSTCGEMQLLETFNSKIYSSRRKSLNFIPYYPTSILASNVSIALNLSGMNYVFATACSSGNYAIGYAYDQIKNGRIKYALAGGADTFSQSIFAGFCRLLAVAPEKCQPFDKNRKGMIPAEGAGMIFLESLESAERRKARIYSEIVGYGLSCDAEHMTSPHSPAIFTAIQNAINSSQINLEEVNYISAHGTGTKENDKAECSALREMFKENIKKIPVSSIKSMLGHTMGAASAIEGIVCSLVIHKNIIPPTINYLTPDQECEIDCVPNISRRGNVKIALNNAFAFGGNNSCMVLKCLE